MSPKPRATPSTAQERPAQHCPSCSPCSSQGPFLSLLPARTARGRGSGRTVPRQPEGENRGKQKGPHGVPVLQSSGRAMAARGGARAQPGAAALCAGPSAPARTSPQRAGPPLPPHLRGLDLAGPHLTPPQREGLRPTPEGRPPITSTPHAGPHGGSPAENPQAPPAPSPPPSGRAALRSPPSAPGAPGSAPSCRYLPAVEGGGCRRRPASAPAHPPAGRAPAAAARSRLRPAQPAQAQQPHPFAGQRRRIWRHPEQLPLPRGEYPITRPDRGERAGLRPTDSTCNQ